MQGMANLQRGDDGRRKRKKAIEEGTHCSDWSALPAVLLELILKQLGVIEFLMFACVCQSWRAVAVALKQEFMSSQGPLVLLMSTNPKKYCYFYNIFDDRLYKTALPYLMGNKCLGFTCGYLVLKDYYVYKTIWLVNPFTRHELKFPRPPKDFSYAILAKSSAQKYVLVAYDKSRTDQCCIQFYRHGDAVWTVYDDHILDVVVFKGKIYFLTGHGKLGTLRLKYSNNNPRATLLPLKTNVSRSGNAHLNLVAYNQQLYVSIFKYDGGSIKIQRLDFEKMDWEDVDMNIGETLFISYPRKSSAFCFPAPLPMSMLAPNPLKGNRLWYLGEEGHSCGPYIARYFSRLDKRNLVIQKDGKPSILFSPPFWYFPHLSCTVDALNEDEE